MVVETSRPITHIARELNINETTLGNWVLDDLILTLMADDGIRATSPAAQLAASRRFATFAI